MTVKRLRGGYRGPSTWFFFASEEEQALRKTIVSTTIVLLLCRLKPLAECEMELMVVKQADEDGRLLSGALP
jgi:hypothetical protein